MQMLGDLSNEELLARLRAHIGTGHAWQARLIDYLAEVERRRLDVECACSSIWDFCVRKLGMSDGEAHRRIAAARIIREFPRALAYLERGDIHLCGLYVLRKHLTAEDHEELLREASGKSTRQVEEIVAARFPKPDVPDRLEPVGMQAPLRMADRPGSNVGCSGGAASYGATSARGAAVIDEVSCGADDLLRAQSEARASERLDAPSQPDGRSRADLRRRARPAAHQVGRERLGKSRPRKVKHAKTHAPVADLDTQERLTASVRDALGRDAASSATEIGAVSAVATTPTHMTPDAERVSAVATPLMTSGTEIAFAIATTPTHITPDDETASAVTTTLARRLPCRTRARQHEAVRLPTTTCGIARTNGPMRVRRFEIELRERPQD